MADPYCYLDDPDFVSLAHTLLEGADDSWDGDYGFEDILISFVRHLEDEVRRLGGCLRIWCKWNEEEPCDHGYLLNPLPVSVRTEMFVSRLREIEKALS